MFTEVFIPVNNLKESFVVNVVESTMDFILVEYNNEKYELPWNDRYSYYRGYVSGLEGFIV